MSVRHLREMHVRAEGRKVPSEERARELEIVLPVCKLGVQKREVVSVQVEGWVLLGENELSEQY